MVKAFYDLDGIDVVEVSGYKIDETWIKRWLSGYYNVRLSCIGEITEDQYNSAVKILRK